VSAEPTSAELVLGELADADQHRRAGNASRALWRVAPLVAAAAVCLAALGRWRGWSPVLPLGVLALTGLALLARTWFMGRRQVVSDAGAASIDHAAGLRGELRSARWFASANARDPWTEYHLQRAARRLADADWPALYPQASAPRAKAATACLAVCAVALALTVPGGTMLLHGSSAPRDRALAAVRANGSAEALLPEVQKQLEALLAAAEKGTVPPGAAPATAAELRSLIARLNALRDAGKLNELARAMAPAPGGQSSQPAEEMKAVAERARKAAEMPTVPPEVRDTLQKVSDDMADAANAAQPPNDKAGQMVSSKDAQQKANAAPGKKGGEIDEASIQSVAEAEAGGGAGIIMMGSEEDAPAKAAPGLGLGGGSDARTNAGRMAELEAALRRETVEASMDNPGDNVQTEARRKTERGQAGVTYSHSSAATFDRGRAVAPPPVPESRRTAVQTYFIRQQ
jgi:hypothetical protein